jgi:hypothetical protein
LSFIRSSSACWEKKYCPSLTRETIQCISIMQMIITHSQKNIK